MELYPLQKLGVFVARPWTFDKARSQNLFPTMYTLDTTTALYMLGDEIPDFLITRLVGRDHCIDGHTL